MGQLYLSILLLLWDNHRMGWTPVPGYEGYYEAREDYSVRSLDRVIIDRRGQFRVLRGRNLSGYRNGTAVMLSRDGEQRLVPVTEIIEMTFGKQAIPA